MRSKLIYGLLSAASLAIATPALAGSEYTSDDVVQFFIDSANLGATRGICIGTADECGREVSKPAGFDMMVNFGLDSADLTQQARENLDEFAKALKDQRLKAANFVVEGHTDARGAERYNDRLSERRAEAVTEFLLDEGVDAAKLTAVGLGQGSPRVPDPYDPVNRRVEMHIKLQ